MATEESQVTVAQSAPEPQTAREGERIYVASQWQLMWWRFRKHKAAILATGLLAILYFVALFCEVLAPYDPNKYDVRFTYAPPMPLRFVDHEGNFHLRPFVYGLTQERDPRTMAMVFTTDYESINPIRFWVRGTPYKLWGIIETDRHLFGVDNPDVLYFPIGADRLGRDMFSRIVYGTRISM